MKDYFIAIEFYNRNINKFINTIVNVDLKKTSLQEVAKQTIEDHFPDIPEDMTIKITAFNNIEI